MDNEEKDMYDELFIDRDAMGCEFTIPSESRRSSLAMIRSKGDPWIRDCGLLRLVDCYWLAATKNLGKYKAKSRDELVKIIQDFGQQQRETKLELGSMLVFQGSRSEKAGDYESALAFYRASLGFPIADPERRYFRLNNLGFCLNFFRRFDQAEEFLRAAVAMSPEQYNAWKNLGVTMEHQAKYEEAAKCYLKAIECRPREMRSVCHFRRLLERQPVLAEKYPDIHHKE